MAKTRGSFHAIQFAGFELTGQLNQFDIAVEFEEIDVTAFQDGAENAMPGLPMGTVSQTAFVDGTIGSSHDALKTVGSPTDKQLCILFGQNALPAIGDPAFAMQCKHYKYNLNAALRAALLATGEFKSSGERPDHGVVLANQQITNTTTFTSVDNGAATTIGGAAYLQVLTPTTADSYQVKVQHSTNDSTFVDLTTFTANGQARTSERKEFAGTINRYTRGIATRAGSAGNPFKLSLVLARH